MTKPRRNQSLTKLPLQKKSAVCVIIVVMTSYTPPMGKAFANVATKLLKVAVVISCLLTPAIAERDFPSPVHDQPPTAKLTSIEWVGKFQCACEKESLDEQCALSFISQGKTYPTSVGASLYAWLIEHPDAETRIRGKITPKFLFWGNVIVVQTFEMASSKP